MGEFYAGKTRICGDQIPNYSKIIDLKYSKTFTHYSVLFPF